MHCGCLKCFLLNKNRSAQTLLVTNTDCTSVTMKFLKSDAFNSYS